MLYLFPRETLATMAALTARVGEHFTATAATITSSLGRRGWLGMEGDGTRRRPHPGRRGVDVGVAGAARRVLRR